MNTKTVAKTRRAKKQKNHATFTDDSPSRDCLRRARMEDDGFMLVLDKYFVWRVDYETVVSRFDEVYDRLIDGVEYRHEDLVCGATIYGSDGVPVGGIEALLCLKHMASLPDARIQEVDWGTFVLAQ